MNGRGCLLVGAVLLLGELLILGIFTITVGHFLAADDALSQADAIVVLGGSCGDFPRVQHALELFDEGYAPVVVFSGGTIERGRMGAGETRRQGEEEKGKVTLSPPPLVTPSPPHPSTSAPMHHGAAPDPRYDAGRWWQTEDGLVAVFTEVIKLGFYWARYGITPVG